MSCCTIARYKTKVLKLLKAFDIIIPAIQQMVTEAIVQGITPIFQQCLDMRLPDVEQRRWQIVLKVLADLENKISEYDWLIHLDKSSTNKLKLQPRRSIKPIYPPNLSHHPKKHWHRREDPQEITHRPRFRRRRRPLRLAQRSNLLEMRTFTFYTRTSSTMH